MNWIRNKILWFMFLLLGGGYSLGAETTLLQPSQFNYPLLANKQIEKLEWVTRSEEVLRLEHNEIGRQFREGIITEAEWNDYLDNTFDEKSKWLGHERSVLRENLGYAEETEFDKTPEGIIEKKRQNDEQIQFKNSTKWNIKADDVFVKNRVSAATEDFTTYTEVDANSDYTVTTSKIDISSIRLDATSYVYIDKTTDHFDGDFDHDWELYQNSATTDGSITGFWAVSNSINDQDAHDAASQSYLLAAAGSEAAGNIQKRIYERDGATRYSDSVNDGTVSEDTVIYMSSVRDESVGTYGTFYLYWYSDSGRTTLLHTNTIALHSSKKDFRYLYGAMSDGRASSITSTGYIQNLDLQEAGAPAIIVPPPPIFLIN